jgi:uncharacterized membrane protein YeaQ/YmgE (transglycosylase-associated protein family)
MNKDQNEYL